MLENKSGIFVINHQLSVREIWLSSPISGPYHFFYQKNELINKDGVNLLDLLSKELNLKLAVKDV